MRAFSPSLLRITNGSPHALKPVPFPGRVDELTLERWVVDEPSLVGEPLLVLGRQLADFEEDRDRLDVLAVDETGEIVLIELKVTEDFRVTDLQALAYAGAYAARDPDDLAHTLRRYLTHGEGPRRGASNGAPTPVSLEEAKAAIAAFLRLEDFSEWQPSQHVRIKLVAPSFPRRVLKTVKWLGDVYDMPIEAIAVRLFETNADQYAVSFERVLPLPGAEEFDMTIRQREDRQREENVGRRPAVLPLLVARGIIENGQTLWLAESALGAEYRHRYSPEDVAFQARVHAPSGTVPKLAWRPSPDADEEIVPPSLVIHRIYRDVFPEWDGAEFTTAVATSFTTEPGGKTLEQVALDSGVWEPTR